MAGRERVAAVGGCWRRRRGSSARGVIVDGRSNREASPASVIVLRARRNEFRIGELRRGRSGGVGDGHDDSIKNDGERIPES